MENHETPLPPADVATTASLSEEKNISDLSGVASAVQDTPVLDAPMPSSDLKICSTLQFSFEELRTRRHQRLSRLQSSSYKCGRTTTERFIKWKLPFKTGKGLIPFCSLSDLALNGY